MTSQQARQFSRAYDDTMSWDRTRKKDRESWCVMLQQEIEYRVRILICEFGEN